MTAPDRTPRTTARPTPPSTTPPRTGPATSRASGPGTPPPGPAASCTSEPRTTAPRPIPRDRTAPGTTPPGAAGLRFGYGTNGFAGHRLADALSLLSDLGYQGVALTLDHCHLDPFAPGLPQRVASTARQLERLGLAVVIETGARYLLDPWYKHAPTLLDDDPRRRKEYLALAMRVGADLGAEAVSFWSGAPAPGLSPVTARQRLLDGCGWAVEEAERHGVVLGFEPEPGMLADTLDSYFELSAGLGDPPRFGLTLDIGHCRCLEPLPVPECVRRAGPRLVNVQIEDMRQGVHEHLEFGTGDIDFPPVLAALAETGYSGLTSVELPRHSHAAPVTAAASLVFLREAAARAPQEAR
ncbi:sugar phosphate isomerase/epimerase family protein [Streptomyces gamaensis]|uniref:Sugar phosphate isomerase/epimerase family protein n=1 Tax=Streptomyces gamaensis TaxID=1763542 RepID=A0ABW0Z2D0_9ACTN